MEIVDMQRAEARLMTDYSEEYALVAVQKPERWLSGRKARILFCAAGTSFVIMLDANIVAVSLPSIARDLHGEFTNVERVVNAYVLPFASLDAGRRFGGSLRAPAHPPVGPLVGSGAGRARPAGASTRPT